MPLDTRPARLVLAALAAACLLAACDRPSPDPAADPRTRSDPPPPELEIPYTIVCTVGMVTDVVRQVAGERAEVIGLLGPGIDPHLYSPTRSDMQRLRSADVVFYNGLLLEGKMTDALVRTASGGARVHAVTESIDPEMLLEPEEFEGHYDPHLWMDPAVWTRAIETVRNELIDVDPEGADHYRANTDAYLEQVRSLDAWAAEVLGRIPIEQRVLVTAHDAFNYFGKRFGFDVLGIQGLSTESEAGVQDIERLVDLIVDRGVRAVFVESTVSERNVRALVAGAKARGHEVVIGGELYSDAMGPGDTYEGTYLGMIDHNVTTIARALGVDVPAGGWQGRLGE